MEADSLLLDRSGFDRPERIHDGKVIMIRFNMRLCSDGLEFTCRKGDVGCLPKCEGTKEFTHELCLSEFQGGMG